MADLRWTVQSDSGVIECGTLVASPVEAETVAYDKLSDFVTWSRSQPPDLVGVTCVVDIDGTVWAVADGRDYLGSDCEHR